MTVTSYFGFWCKYCHQAHMIIGEENLKKYNHHYLGLMEDNYYETHVTCPGCGERLVFRESSIFNNIK